MNVLYFVSRPLEINTSASIRNRAIILGLIEGGHKVTLVTTEPDENHTSFDSGMKIDEVECMYIKLNGIQKAARVGRKFGFLRPLKNLASDILERRTIYDNLSEVAKHTDCVKDKYNIEKYDCIISSSDPKSSHLFVEKLLEDMTRKPKWIQLWGDPFFADITMSKKANKKKIYSEEKRLISKADKVFYVSRITLDSQKELFSEFACKMDYIPIPYMKEKIYKLNDLKEKETLSLAYCGDYIDSVRNILPLYDAIKKLDFVNMKILGRTDISIESTKNIEIKGRQNIEVVEEIEANADVLVHLSNRLGGQIPGKIYQYCGTNKPILFILDGEIDLLLQQFKQYDRFIFAENNEEDIITAIKQIKNESRSYMPVKCFSKKDVAEKLIGN